uniref:MULE transposase domain-containing protein n=1 Tax=Trichogramma kaykai TaxID=54128 RepID=A0ABD2W2T9_9HYME
MEFKRELFRRCQETGDELVSIWNNMTLEFPNVAAHLRYTGVLSSMHKYRRLRAPPVPGNLQELAATIGQYDPIRSLYIGHCEDDNGGIALMFMHAEMREPLMECTALFGDGTFKALRRYWYWKCHIPENFHNILEYAMALAYLPAERMEEGFNVVMGLMVYNNVPNAQRFNNYFRRQWLPLANVISIHGRRIRTNNVCENFHLHAKTFIGVRQGLWLMLERLGKLANMFVIRYETAVRTGILHWSWPAELLRADRDLMAMEPTLPEIGVRQYLDFVVRQRRGRFLPELENDDENENENDGVVNEGDNENDVLFDELNRIGLNIFIAQDEIGAEFEIGVPPDQRIRLAPMQVRIQDLPDDAELHNPFAPNRRGRGRAGRARGRAGGARARAPRARAPRARGGAGRGRGRTALPPVQKVPVEEVHQEAPVVVVHVEAPVEEVHQEAPEVDVRVEALAEEVRQEIREVDVPEADPQGLQVPGQGVILEPPVRQELPARQEELPVEDVQVPQEPGEVVVEPPNVAEIPAEQHNVHREDIQAPLEPAAEIMIEQQGLGMPAVQNQEDIQEELPHIEEAEIQPINEPVVAGEESN